MEPGTFVKTNVLGTQVLLDASLKGQVKRFHHISTDEVFGALALDDTKKFSEKTSYDPRSPYAASKAGSDHLVRAYHTTYGLPVSITNCSNNFGPYQFPEKFIPLAITNLLENKKVPVYGDGFYVRDWLYVEDHCRAIDIVLQKGTIGETYCVGGVAEDVSNLEVIKRILNLLQKDESMIEYVKDRPGHDRRYAIDWSKINLELGWKPDHNFDEWLEKTVSWYKEHRGWWEDVKTGAYKSYYKKQYDDR
jgi:dTDP-glucose 4,6-dehydratase